MKLFFNLCAAILFLSGCDLCSNNIKAEYLSPNSKYISTVFERNCGATTPYIQVVSMRDFSSKFKPEADDDWVFTIQGQPDIRVSWLNSAELEITYSGGGDKPTQRTKWGKITVSYQ